jgi:hypothetical protein
MVFLNDASIYLSGLNQSTQMDTAGTVDGSTETAPITRYTINSNTTVSDFRDAFSVLFDETVNLDYNNSLVLSNYTTYNKDVTHVLFTDPTSTLNAKVNHSVYGAAYDFLKFLSGEVFGSESAVDLFNNPYAVADNWVSKNNTSLHSLNNNTSSGVTQTMFNSLLKVVPERFGMEYKAILVDSSFNPVNGIYDATITSSNTSATLSVKIDNTNDVNGNKITGIKVLTAGSGFSYDDLLTFNFTAKGEDNVDHVFNVKIEAINSVQKALLNGESVVHSPVEKGDKFIARLRTNMAAQQRNSSAEIINSPPTHDASVLIELM